MERGRERERVMEGGREGGREESEMEGRRDRERDRAKGFAQPLQIGNPLSLLKRTWVLKSTHRYQNKRAFTKTYTNEYRVLKTIQVFLNAASRL